MDAMGHAQLIYAHLLQAWVASHPGQIEESTLKTLASNAMLAAKVFHKAARE